jgi:hypothetical protein
MKKYLTPFCAALAILSLSSCGNTTKDKLKTNQLEPSMGEEMAVNTQVTNSPKKRVFTDFIYDIGPRFRPVKREVVQKARSIDAFISKEELDKIEHIKSVTVTIMDGYIISDIIETGTSASFSEAQLKLLKGSDYSTNLMIHVEFQQMNAQINTVKNNYASSYLTIIPEKQASYLFSEETLKDYLRVQSEESRVGLDPKKLRPAKLYFTVTKDGSVENVRLDKSSFYPVVDGTMITLIKNLPGSWTPAENANGEKVKQELVLSFGLLGC